MLTASTYGDASCYILINVVVVTITTNPVQRKNHSPFSLSRVVRVIVEVLTETLVQGELYREFAHSLSR